MPGHSIKDMPIRCGFMAGMAAKSLATSFANAWGRECCDLKGHTVVIPKGASASEAAEDTPSYPRARRRC